MPPLCARGPAAHTQPFTSFTSPHLLCVPLLGTSHCCPPFPVPSPIWSRGLEAVDLKTKTSQLPGPQVCMSVLSEPSACGAPACLPAGEKLS